MIRRLNHISLAVSDLERSLAFYSQVLGFTVPVKWRNGAYLSAGDLWLCLELCSELRPKLGQELKPDSTQPCTRKDDSHIAFDANAAQFTQCCQRLRAHEVREWKVNSIEGQSLYFLDPDGHKLEIHVGNLSSRLAALRKILTMVWNGCNLSQYPSRVELD